MLCIGVCSRAGRAFVYHFFPSASHYYRMAYYNNNNIICTVIAIKLYLRKIVVRVRRVAAAASHASGNEKKKENKNTTKKSSEEPREIVARGCGSGVRDRVVHEKGRRRDKAKIIIIICTHTHLVLGICRNRVCGTIVLS